MNRLYRAKKLSSGLYKVVRPGDIFLLGISQSPGPILISWQVFVLARNRYNSGSPLYFVRGGSEIISGDAVQGGILFLFNFTAGRDAEVVPGEKYLSGLYADGAFRKVFVPEQDWCAQYNLFPHNFAAGRDGWVIPSEKMPSGLYIAVRPEGIFLLGISQSPGPPEIYRLWIVSG